MASLGGGSIKMGIGRLPGFWHLEPEYRDAGLERLEEVFFFHGEESAR